MFRVILYIYIYRIAFFVTVTGNSNYYYYYLIIKYDTQLENWSFYNRLYFIIKKFTISYIYCHYYRTYMHIY
jgi:hypothetical protein